MLVNDQVRPFPDQLTAAILFFLLVFFVLLLITVAPFITLILFRAAAVRRFQPRVFAPNMNILQPPKRSQANDQLASYAALTP